MPVDKGKEWTFNTVAELYEKIRPGYPDELYNAIFAYVPIDGASHAVEVGIGGGQATLPVLKTGCNVTAVGIREKFFDAVEKTINRHGGVISIYDTIDLQLARKPF